MRSYGPKFIATFSVIGNTVCIRNQVLCYILATIRIFKIKNPSIFEEIRGILVKTEKVPKSDKNSVNDCTPRLIAGGQMAQK